MVAHAHAIGEAWKRIDSICPHVHVMGVQAFATMFHKREKEKSKYFSYRHAYMQARSNDIGNKDIELLDTERVYDLYYSGGFKHAPTLTALSLTKGIIERKSK